MDHNKIIELLGTLDKEIFPNNPIPISRGKTKNNAPAQYERLVWGPMVFEEYVVSNKNRPEWTDENISELEIVVHEIRHRVQCELLKKEFLRWSSFEVKLTENATHSSRKLALWLKENNDLREFDAELCAIMARSLFSEGKSLKDIKKLLKSPLKKMVEFSKQREIILNLVQV